MKTKDLFTQISDFQHSLGIYLTFPFENEIVEKIRDHSSGRTVILYDYKHGEILKNNYENRVMCIPAFPRKNTGRNVFHAKLILLKGQRKCKLFVGSMNLTKESFRSPKELCCSIDLEYHSETYQSLLDYLRQIDCLNPERLRDLIKELTIKNGSLSEKEQLERKGNLFFVFNTENKSVSHHLLGYHNKLGGSQKPILRIASPYVSKDLGNGFDYFADQIKPKEIHFYLRSRTPLPPQIKERSENIKLYRPKQGNRAGFHAKVVLIDYGNFALAYIGSANFTRSGFFQNLDDGANQECGVILRLSKNEDIFDWFAKGWEKPVDPTNWEEDGEGDGWGDLELYGYAEKINGGYVLVSLFLPDKLNEREVKVKIENKVCNLTSMKPGFYQGKIKSTRNQIILMYKHKELTIPVFDINQFEEARKHDGDGLFSAESSPVESTNESTLALAIKNKGIKIQGTDKLLVIEPPLLEQFFHNVKEQIRFIERKKRFNESHFEELKKELKEQYGGTGIYFISHLYKTFKNKNAKEFSEECFKRINELLLDLSMPKTNYAKFLKHWVGNG